MPQRHIYNKLIYHSLICYFSVSQMLLAFLIIKRGSFRFLLWNLYFVIVFGVLVFCCHLASKFPFTSEKDDCLC